MELMSSIIDFFPQHVVLLDHFLPRSLRAVVFIFLPFADHSGLLFLVEGVPVLKSTLYFRLFGHAVLDLVVQVLLAVLLALLSTILYLCSLERVLLKLAHPGHLRLFLSLLKPLINIFRQRLSRSLGLPLILSFNLKGSTHFVLEGLHLGRDVLIIVILRAATPDKAGGTDCGDRTTTVDSYPRRAGTSL